MAVGKSNIIYNGLILHKNGSIDWEANGWPEPNPGAETRLNGLSIDGMPDEIFDIWMDECDLLEDNWEIDG